MKIRKEDLRGTPPQGGSELLNATGNAYRSFNDWVAFGENDPIWLITMKLLGRIFGILIMIILSPFVIIGLVIAFAAVL
jgi:hypothetical protein